jgi:hypothetical protein
MSPFFPSAQNGSNSGHYLMGRISSTYLIENWTDIRTIQDAVLKKLKLHCHMTYQHMGRWEIVVQSVVED